MLPNKNGISNTLSPSEIVIGTPKIDATESKLQPGPYVNFKIKARSTNNTKKGVWQKLH